MVAGNVLNRMGFVKNDGVVIGEDVDSESSQRKVAKKEGVINDQDISILQSFSCFEIVAVRVTGALPSQAVSTVTFDFVPHTRQHLQIEICP